MATWRSIENPDIGISALTEPLPRLRFPRSHRLSGAKRFRAVFAARTRKTVGPLTVYARANGLPHARLGLSVSRKVGPAVKRNRVKRRLREAYRLAQHDWPVGYDWVVVVRPHDTLALGAYQELMGRAVTSLDRRLSDTRERP